MRRRLARFAAVALVPTVVDIGVLVALRQGLGWVLVLADAVAIAVASGLSYVLHRTITFRSDPYVRWVRLPAAFVAIAAVAGLIDVTVLRLVHAAHGFDTVAGLVVAKVLALSVAAVVRLAGYRLVLVRQVRRRADEPVPRPATGDRALSIVIPALDEASRIGATIDRLRLAAADRGLEADDLDVVVVDDGSSDGTADAALEGGADQVIVHAARQGKGAAVRSGVQVSRGRVVLFTDADLAYDPDEVMATARRVDEGWDVVLGNRRHPAASAVVAASPLRQWGSRGINFVTHAVLLGGHRDTQCGLKAFHGDVARALFSRSRVDGFAFDIEILHLAERHGCSMLDVPVRVTNSDRSTVRVVSDAIGLLRDLWRIRHWSATGAYELDPADESWPAGRDQGAASRSG